MATLFEPLLLGPITVSNRLALAPMKTALGTPDGKATTKHAAYYRRRAEGGVGLIITEPLFVESKGKEHPKQLGIDDDGKVEGLQRIVEQVHGAGRPVFAHINHAGRAANPKVIGQAPEAPSAIPCPSTGATPTVLSIDRIHELVQAYGRATARAARAGFDGVEVQFGLGYLVAQFLSKRTNQRADDYGNPWKFAEEIADIVVANLAPHMAWTLRLSIDERVQGGLGMEQAIELANKARDWNVSALHVVTGSACDSPAWYYQHMGLPSGVNETLALELRKTSDLPMIVAGRMGNPEKIQQVIDRGLDAVALGRPLLADPDFALKMRERKEDWIQGCGSCLQGCLGRVKAGGPIGCLVNPEVGYESEPLEKASHSKRIVIIGGGPAGLQAGITAKQRGHRVTLLEKNELGGQFSAASLAPGKSDMALMHTSLAKRAQLEGVEIRLGVHANEAQVVSLAPDEVIVATGSQAIHLSIPGLEKVYSGLDVLSGRMEFGKRALVIGGGLVGIEVAEYLAEKAVSVVVVEALDDIARDMEPITRKMTMSRLQGLAVTIHRSARVMRVEKGAVFIRRDGFSDVESLGYFDSFVMAVGNRAVDELSENLRNEGLKVHVIGDAMAPKQVWDATQAAYQLARTL